ncbi:MAG: ABC transporter permease [Candidatus Margulisiibacteriota bacterium]
MLDSRLFHLIKKEFIQLTRDKRLIGAVIIAPILQLIIFGYVATTDVRDIPTVVLDFNRTSASREFTETFANTGYFSINYYVSNFEEEKALLNSGKVKAAINIPQDFAKDIKAGRSAEVQFVVDGANSNSASIILGYIQGITFDYSMKVLKDRFRNIGNVEDKINIINAKVRVFHNQTLSSTNYMIPGIIAMLLTLITAVLTSISIVKEKEYGTLEQLIVTPVKPYELMVSKMAPYIILSLIDVVLVMLVAVFWFKVPILGSIPLLFALISIFLVTNLGLGLYISTISANMQQTVLSVVFIMIPSMLLSGFIFPIANMPAVIQPITYLIPMRYFLTIVRGIFLKGIGIEYLWKDALLLSLLGGLIFTMAARKFRKKLE